MYTNTLKACTYQPFKSVDIYLTRTYVCIYVYVCIYKSILARNATTGKIRKIIGHAPSKYARLVLGGLVAKIVLGGMLVRATMALNIGISG